MILFGAYLYRRLSRRRESRGEPALLPPGVPSLTRMLAEELLILGHRLRRFLSVRG